MHVVSKGKSQTDLIIVLYCSGEAHKTQQAYRKTAPRTWPTLTRTHKTHIAIWNDDCWNADRLCTATDGLTGIGRGR